MMLKIKNENGEDLDAIIDGSANATVIFVHGLGTDKYDGANIFGDIAEMLSKRFRTVLFDLSGCGVSGGKEENSNLLKWSRDLNSVIDFVKTTYGGDIIIIAHSFGTFVTSKLSPNGIRIAVFLSMANIDTSGRFIKDRIRSRGGVVDENGISTYPRTAGGVQKFGPEFWKELERFEPVESIGTFAKKTKLTIIDPNQDEIVKDENRKGYSDIPNLKYVRMDGDHNFSKPVDRKALLDKVAGLLKQ